MACLSCGRQFHDECENGGCNNCHPDVEKLARTLTSTSIGVGAPIKNQQDLKDRKSTGRKRAAMLYPIFPDKSCDWQGKKNCGGGKHPIVGCISGLQKHCHHGPIKDPVRNEMGNVHRICHHCHNRWHAMNDPDYDEAENENLPHQPTIADEMELLANEAYWRTR